MNPGDITFSAIRPCAALADVVESFWSLTNNTGKVQEVMVMPDGRIDLLFSASIGEPFHAVLLGLGSKAEPAVLKPGLTMFAISFKLPAVEYILGYPIADLLNTGTLLPAGFWNITSGDLDDFVVFGNKATEKILSLFKAPLDEKKRTLFNLIYDSQGAMTVKALSGQSFWSSRQINRYFHKQFGLSLKTYCNILRFRAALPQINEGNFFPEDFFFDQPHFIKEVKRFSGVTPKELYKNKNGRFIQFSALSKK